MDRTGLLCGEQTGLESNNKLKTLNGEHNKFFLVLLPVTAGSTEFVNFDLETDEAFWRLKISREGCSENIPTIIDGKMKLHAGIDLN